MNPAQLIIRIALILAVPVFIAVCTFIFLQKVFLSPLEPESKEVMVVEIAPGRSFSDISKDLKEKKVIGYAWSMDLLAQFMKADTKIQAGEYEVSPSMSPRAVIDKLISGEVVKRVVMIKPGTSIKELPPLVESAGLVSAAEFANALHDPVLLTKAGIGFQSFEGYLFPETYQFSRPITPWQIIFKMIEESEKHWPQEFTVRADDLRMSRHEVLTLASIIEKEAGNEEEKPIISSVFHNRLKEGIKLQADPTIIYGLENFDGNLREEDIKNPHPYNTYVHFGLPPGPICNSSESSIRAVLYPAETSFLYFVADGTGKHVFSTTYQEHREAVDKFQKGRGAPPPPQQPAAPPPPAKP